MARDTKSARKIIGREHYLCAEIRKSIFCYSIVSHQSPRVAERIEDEAIIKLEAGISKIEPVQLEHVGERIECSLVCSRSFSREKSDETSFGGCHSCTPSSFRRSGRSMLAYLPADAFWAIQDRFEAGTLKHLE